MTWKTIDLDAPGGYDKYKKLRETKSVKKTFDEDISTEETEEKPEEPVTETKQENATETINEQTERKGLVTGVQQLRVRKNPGGDVLYLISEGSIVKILADDEGWYRVETAPDRTGYVMKQFIKEYSEGG